MTTRIPLRCACCPLPFGYLQQTVTGAWVVVIESYHYPRGAREKHTNFVTVAGLEALLNEGIQALEGVVT